MVRSQDGEVFQSTLYKGQPMGRPLKKKREEIMKRFLLQGNYIMFDYFQFPHKSVSFWKSASHSPQFPSYPPACPPPLLNGKRAAAEIDPRPAVWIGNLKEELHELNFLWGFQWYTWPSLKVDFDLDSIEFEDILSCTYWCLCKAIYIKGKILNFKQSLQLENWIGSEWNYLF